MDPLRRITINRVVRLRAFYFRKHFPDGRSGPTVVPRRAIGSATIAVTASTSPTLQVRVRADDSAFPPQVDADPHRRPEPIGGDDVPEADGGAVGFAELAQGSGWSALANADLDRIECLARKLAGEEVGACLG
jgi:hypothetical protein